MSPLVLKENPFSSNAVPAVTENRGPCRQGQGPWTLGPAPPEGRPRPAARLPATQGCGLHGESACAEGASVVGTIWTPISCSFLKPQLVLGRTVTSGSHE